MNIRTPHNVTILHNVGTEGKPEYIYFYLYGVKLDGINARMVARNGYNSADSMRMIIYLTDVQPSLDTWKINKNDYFCEGIVEPTPTDLAAWKKTHNVFKVSSMTKKTTTIPMLHHIEVTGG